MVKKTKSSYSLSGSSLTGAKLEVKLPVTSQALVPVGASVVTAKEEKKKSRRSRKRRAGGASGIVKDYLNTLKNPFRYPGVPLGFRTLAATENALAYLRFNFKTDSSLDGVVVVFNPDAAGLQVTDSTNRINNFCSYTSFAGSAVVATAPYTPSNYYSLNTMFSSFRIVSAGMRVWVSYPMTSSSPIIGCLDLTGINSIGALNSFTPNNVMGFPSTQMEMAGNGRGIATACWTPVDYSDMSFNRLASADNGEGLYNTKIVALQGLPVGSVVQVECIAHLECLTGAQYPAVSGGADEITPMVIRGTVEDSIKMSESQFFRYVKSATNGVRAFVDATMNSEPAFNAAIYLSEAAAGMGAGYSAYRLARHQHLLRNVQDIPIPIPQTPPGPSPPPPSSPILTREKTVPDSDSDEEKYIVDLDNPIIKSSSFHQNLRSVVERLSRLDNDKK